MRRYAREALIEIRKLYRLLLFCWWTQNGDMHLKNFSLITARDGIRRLAPAYDLACTRLVIPDDALAMPIGGRDRNLTRGKWLDFAEYCQIPEKTAMRVISEQTRALEPALRLISASYLPDDMKDAYRNIVRHRTDALAA